jgi:hypothetical protein
MQGVLIFNLIQRTVLGLYDKRCVIPVFHGIYENSFIV